MCFLLKNRVFQKVISKMIIFSIFDYFHYPSNVALVDKQPLCQLFNAFCCDSSVWQMVRHSTRFMGSHFRDNKVLLPRLLPLIYPAPAPLKPILRQNRARFSLSRFVLKEFHQLLSLDMCQNQPIFAEIDTTIQKFVKDLFGIREIVLTRKMC